MASILTSCSGDRVIEGGLYWVENDDRSYSVVKVLKVDPEGVHVRLYSNRFASPPTDVEVSTLYMVGVNRKPEESLGLGHMPIRTKGFLDWRPQFIKQVTVSEEELEGYREWESAKGGYF
jgi:hypothetical protein